MSSECTKTKKQWRKKRERGPCGRVLPFPHLAPFKGVLKSYEDNHCVKFVIRHWFNKESEKFDGPQKCSPPPPTHTHTHAHLHAPHPLGVAWSLWVEDKCTANIRCTSAVQINSATVDPILIHTTKGDGRSYSNVGWRSLAVYAG
jgi:hypothetical protein